MKRKFFMLFVQLFHGFQRLSVKLVTIMKSKTDAMILGRDQHEEIQYNDKCTSGQQRGQHSRERTRRKEKK